MDEILTASEAADYLKVNVRTIYRLISKGKIPGRKVGGSWRFKKDILDDWLADSGGIFPVLFKKNPSNDAFQNRGKMVVRQKMVRRPDEHKSN